MQEAQCLHLQRVSGFCLENSKCTQVDVLWIMLKVKNVLVYLKFLFITTKVQECLTWRPANISV